MHRASESPTGESHSITAGCQWCDGRLANRPAITTSSVLKRVELLGIRKSAVGRRSDGSLEYEPGVPIRARFGSLAVGSLSKIERGPMEKIE